FVCISGSHSLQYYISVTSAPIAGVPRYTITGYLDGLQYGKYNSKIPFVQPLIPSLKALTEHLELQMKYAQEFLKYQKQQVAYFTSIFNKTSVHPNVKILNSESNSLTELHCWVYGFYPRDVEVKWIKNGRDEIYSEESAEILPNPDGTYQIRVSVEVTPEEGATYSCHVDHSSLENPLVVPMNPTTDIICISSSLSVPHCSPS
ncbi:hypothetical protein XELAEV_18000260mg, partial [Xenopus laevis]